jgi:hypothetical protein
MPLGSLDALAVAIRPAFARGEREVADILSAGRLAQLGVAAEITDENGFVDTGHVVELHRD